MLGAIVGFQALDEAWQAFPRTIPDPTKHLANVVKSKYGGMNMLGLSTPMYTWQNVMDDLRTSPKDAAANVGRGVGTAKPAQVKIVKFKDGVEPIHGVRQSQKRGAPNIARDVRRQRPRRQSPESSESDDDNDGDDGDDDSDRSSESSQSKSQNAVPIVRPPQARARDFAALALEAAADPNAPRAKRVRIPRSRK